MKLTWSLAAFAVLATSSSAQILQEDFENGIPDTWQVVGKIFPSVASWQAIAPTACGNGTGLIAFTGPNCLIQTRGIAAVDSTIETHPITLAGPGPYTLQFDSTLAINVPGDRANLWVLVQSHTTSLHLATEATLGNNAGTQTLSFQLPASLEGESVRIQFHAVASLVGGGHTVGWAIDNFSLTGASGIQRCFGSGQAVPCPCGNNAAAANSGCTHSASSGQGAVLRHRGRSRASEDSLSFVVFGAVPFSTAILVSGDNALPAANPGAGIPFGDGLRCVGGNLIRHDTRNLGSTGAAYWGIATIPSAPSFPPEGLIAQGGYSVGQTRHWQVIYRDDPTAGCGSGINSSQSIELTISP